MNWKRKYLLRFYTTILIAILLATFPTANWYWTFLRLISLCIVAGCTEQAAMRIRAERKGVRS